MPKLIKRIPETERSVLRNVVLEVSRKLFQEIGIHPDTRIYYPGEGTDKAPQPGSTMNVVEKQLEPNTFPFSQRIKIEVDEEYEADRLGATAIHRAEHFPVFRDDALFALMKPVYSSSEITLNFKYRAADKTEAARWRDEIRVRYSDAREVYEHKASFHWEPPVAFMKVLKEIHRLREAKAGYGEDFDTYFKNHADARASKLMTQAGTDQTWEISETAGNIIGYFDFVGGPEKGDKEGEGDAWMTAFSFKFRFEKPIACVLHYPLYVHNQVIGKEWRPSMEDTKAVPTAKSHVLSSLAYDQFRGGKTFDHWVSTNGYSLPSFDEFLPKSIVSSTMRILTALSLVKEDTPRAMFSLANLGKVKFTPRMIEFLKSEAPFMARPYFSVFTLSLYEDVDLLPGAPITIDSNLNITSVADLDVRKSYHVRLGLVTDWTLLTRDALIRLGRFGDIVLELIKVIDPYYNGELPKIIGTNFIPKPELEKAIDIINRGILTQGNRQGIAFNTVGTLFIEAH